MRRWAPLRAVRVPSRREGGASTGTTQLTKRQRERLEALVSKKAPYSLAPCRHPREFPALADFLCFRKLHEDYYRRVRRTFGAERPTTTTREPSAHATLGSAKSRASAKSTGSSRRGSPQQARVPLESRLHMRRWAPLRAVRVPSRREVLGGEAHNKPECHS
ncbi:uncharacterized protein LOC144100983 [Amblyomma americanum]